MNPIHGDPATIDAATLARESVPILAARPAWLASGAITALVHLNAAARPDVRDLGRVLADEGEGDPATSYTLTIDPAGRASIVLTVEYRRPVICAFTIAFDPATARDLLVCSLLAATGWLLISTGPSSRPSSLIVVQTPADEVASLLQAVAARCWTVLP